MKIETSVIKMTESEAKKKGESKSNFIGRLLVRSKMSKLELVYFPFLLVEFNQECTQGIFHIEKQRKDERNNNIKTIIIICDGTTNSTALTDTLPDLSKTEVDKVQIKERLFTEQDMVSAAHKLAFRMTRRFFGNRDIVLHYTREIYRPYYIAWYGDITESNKARYLPIAADGFNINREI
jgi:hypothetical protein